MFATRRPSRRYGAVLAMVAMVLPACGSDQGGAGGTDPVLVATTSIWADVVDNVACEGGASIETLIPAGGDPHSFEPSLADRARLEEADLVIANGLALEEGLVDTLDAVESAGVTIFAVAEHVSDPLPYRAAEPASGDEPGESHDDGDDHDAEGLDPHVWFDPMRVSEVLPELGGAIADATGLDRTAIERCVAMYQDELAAVDAEIAALVDAVPPADRKLVTSHEALGYFADRYDFEVIGTIIPAPSGLAETSAAQLERLASLIESEGVQAIFAEEQHSADDAEALAAQVGPVDVVTLLTGSLGQPESEAGTYTGLLQTTARAITDALR